MKELIYYPGFEVKRPDWLKFALLYIEKLNPIIPFSGEKHLTEFYKRLIGETDLIHVNRPEYEDGTKATLDALEVSEKILMDPKRYLRVFNTPDVIERWRNPAKQDYTLFQEKYTYQWEQFCIKNQLAKKAPQGLLLHREFAFIYMSILAQAIADSRGVSPITDDTILDKFSILTRRSTEFDHKKLNVAQSTIELKLPSNLAQISVDEIIKFRNRPGFKQRLRAFHAEFDKFFDKIQDESTETEFVNSFGSIWNDFSDEIVKLGFGASSFGLGVWILAKSPSLTSQSYFREVVLGGASLVAGSIISIRSTWNNTETKRFCRRYLADLESIHPVRRQSRISKWFGRA